MTKLLILPQATHQKKKEKRSGNEMVEASKHLPW